VIQFLLNEQLQVVDGIDPATSILDYLRLHQSKTGSKEGCASGDCGACTVAIAEIANDKNKLEYKAVNACITPVATLAGKQLITVEDLKQGEELHPIQQTMVDKHASQCGFCTPGFVMSLFAWNKGQATDDQHAIEEALGGNLCRCTGYRPIVDAAKHIGQRQIQDQFSQQQQQTVEKLKQLAAQQQTSPRLTQDHMGFYMPASEQELQLLMETYPHAKLIAGGTDLNLEFTQQLKHHGQLIYMGNIPELQQVNEVANKLKIGAGVTYSACQNKLTEHYPQLKELIERLGSKQIRNQGTLVGNIANASPIGDMPPVLIALNAELELVKGQTKRKVKLDDFFVDYKQTLLQQGEYIAHILLPLPEKDQQFRVYKISKRLEDDISAVCGAFSLNIQKGKISQVRIAFGGMAATPKRASSCEQAMLGQTLNQETIDKAKQAIIKDFQPISDFRASSEYRSQISQNLLQRLLWECQHQDTLRITQHA